jgi:predicted MFS family arabinose efflux permease
MSTVDQADAAAPEPASRAETGGPSRALLTVIAIATGVLVANLYYAQPLIASIGPELKIPPSLAGTLVSVTQIGYGVGLFLLVSAADLIENKRLVLLTLAGLTAALIVASASSSAALFFLASFVIGVSSTGAQVLIPFASHLVPEARRGRTVGNIMAGLLTGILLARPLSLFIASAIGWRPVFWLSAIAVLVIGIALVRIMPKYVPHGRISYGRVLVSIFGLLRDQPVLRRRALYQALMFAAFNLFWTASPLMLADSFHLSQQGIALFALAGAGGALAAPLAGRLADHGLGQLGTGGAMAALAVAFLLTCWATPAGLLAVLAIMAVVIDAAVQFNQIISQRTIFLLAPESRGRVNAAYMTVSFFGGAIGSTLATATYHWGGWTATAGAGAALGVVALIAFATELRR